MSSKIAGNSMEEEKDKEVQGDKQVSNKVGSKLGENSSFTASLLKSKWHWFLVAVLVIFSYLLILLVFTIYVSRSEYHIHSLHKENTELKLQWHEQNRLMTAKISQLEKFENEHQEILSSLSNIQLNISHLHTQLKVIPERLDEMSEQITDLSVSRDDHENQLGVVNTSITNISQTLVSVSRKVQDLSHSRDDYWNQLGIVNTSISIISKTLVNESHKVQDLSLSRDEHWNQLTVVNTSISNISQILVKMSHSLEDLSLSRDEHWNQLTVVNTSISNISQILVKMSHRVQDLSLSRDEHWDQLGVVNSSISAISQELMAVNSRLQSLNDTQLSHGQSIAHQSHDLILINTHLIDLETAHNSTVTGMERLRQEVNNNNSILSTQLTEATVQLGHLSAQSVMLSQAHASHQLQLNGIQRNISSIVNKQARVDGQVAVLESSHQSQSREISSLRSELTGAKADTANNKIKISKADDDISSLQSNIFQAQSDRSYMKQRLRRLERYHSGTISISPPSFITSVLVFLCVFYVV